MRQSSSRWSARRQLLTAGAVRAGVGVVQAVAPGAAGAVAERLWFMPPRPSAAVRLRTPVPDGAEPLTVRVLGRDLRGFTVGEGPPVVLIHGWGGRVGQFGPLAAALAQAGVTATALDLPGHGADPARRADLFQWAEALRALRDLQGPPALTVGHSLGAMAATLTYDDVPPAAAVFVAPALSIEQVLGDYARRLALRPATVADLRVRLQRFIGDAWERIDRGADLDWPGGPLLIVHDRDDPQTPFAVSAALAERRDDVDLLEVRGPGHSRVLRDPTAVRAITAFVATNVPARTA